MSRAERHACACRKCRSACHTVPGWFHPDEVEAVAATFGVDVDTFARTWCVVDWHQTDPTVLALAPARVDDIAAGRMDTDSGPVNETCALLRDAGCALPLALRPHECACYTHRAHPPIRPTLVEAWRGVRQDQLRTLMEGSRLPTNEPASGMSDRCGSPHSESMGG